jgi:hypothetical protein
MFLAIPGFPTLERPFKRAGGSLAIEYGLIARLLTNRLAGPDRIPTQASGCAPTTRAQRALGQIDPTITAEVGIDAGKAVRFSASATIGRATVPQSLLDHLIRIVEDVVRHRQTKRLCSLEIDGQLELGRLLDR